MPFMSTFKQRMLIPLVAIPFLLLNSFIQARKRISLTFVPLVVVFGSAPPGKRKGKLINNACQGIFLGYLPHTTKNILWYDVETHRVKIAFHARFDKGMNDLPAELIPPNVQHLQRVRDGLPFDADDTNLSVTAFGFCDSFFSMDIDDIVRITCTHPTYGFQLAEDTETGQVYVQNFVDHGSALSMRSSPHATI